MLAVAIAYLVALGVAGLVAALRILDHPNDRSSHSQPTPRGAGAGIVVGFVAALSFALPDAPGFAVPLAGIGLIGALAGILGFVDDIFSLSEKVKFVVLAGLSLALAAIAGPVTGLGIELPWIIGLLGSALWVFTTANAVNFMDGSDGIMAATLIPASLALAWLAPPEITVACLVLAAAIAGFAVWNAPIATARGKAFSGDVGSLGASVLFAGLSLFWAAQAGGGAAWIVPLLLLPFLGDVLLTMASRAKAGRRLFSAHRSHAYQLLIQLEFSHRQVALIWGGMSLACGGLAILAAALPASGAFAVFVLAVLVFTLVHRRIRKRAAAAGLDVT